MDNESTTAPLIWVEKDQGSVVTENKYVITGETNKKNQTFYYSKADYVNVVRVSTLKEFEDAVANANVDTIRLDANITGITKTVSVARTLTIEGESHKLTFTTLEKVGEVASGLVLMANDIKVTDLTVEMTAEDGWQGNYAMQVYNATGVVLNNVTAVNGDAGLLVNSSEVELTGTTTLNGNEFGGIEVSKSSNEEMRNSKLTVTGTIVMDNESTTAPLIWVVKGQGSVVPENKYVSKDMDEKGQIFYFTYDSVIKD